MIFFELSSEFSSQSVNVTEITTLSTTHIFNKFDQLEIVLLLLTTLIFIVNEMEKALNSSFLTFFII